MVAVRQLEPERVDGREAVRLRRVGAVRLLAHDGGYAGGQAQYARVPFADVGPMKVPDGSRDEQVLFLSDIFPTGYMAAENCNIQPGDIVAVWGCGPVGQMAIASALMLGAERVIAIDCVPERLRMAARPARCETINFDERGRLRSAASADRRARPGFLHRRGRARGARRRRSMPTTIGSKTAAFLATDRPNALRQAIHACRKGGMVSIPGVYGGFLDKMPFGAAFGKGLTFKMGQTHVMKYMQPLLDRIETRRDRSVVRDHASSADRRAAEGVQDVPRQARTSASRWS